MPAFPPATQRRQFLLILRSASQASRNPRGMSVRYDAPRRSSTAHADMPVSTIQVGVPLEWPGAHTPQLFQYRAAAAGPRTIPRA